MSFSTKLLIATFFIIFAIFLVRDLNNTQDSLQVLKNELSESSETSLSVLPENLKNTYIVEITQTDLNKLLSQNKNDAGENPISKANVSLKENSGLLIIEWKEGQRLEATIVVAPTGLTLQPLNVKVSGAGLLNKLLEDFGKELLSSILSNISSKEQGILQKIEIKEGKLVMYYLLQK